MPILAPLLMLVCVVATALVVADVVRVRNLVGSLIFVAVIGITAVVALVVR